MLCAVCKEWLIKADAEATPCEASTNLISFIKHRSSLFNSLGKTSIFATEDSADNFGRPWLNKYCFFSRRDSKSVESPGSSQNGRENSILSPEHVIPVNPDISEVLNSDPKDSGTSSSLSRSAGTSNPTGGP